MSLSRSVVISKRLSSEVGHHGPKRVASMRDYLFKPTAPPNTELRPWIPEVVFIPIERAVERLGVYFYNRVIHPSEMGLFHKAYNPRVHGPYCHHRWYGKQDTKLLDVKLTDLPAWFGRREFTIGAIYNEFWRNFWRIHWNYVGRPMYPSVFPTFFRWFFWTMFFLWIMQFPTYWDFRWAIYHCKMSSSSAAGSQRGAFIVLEGLDRSGKTTQSEKLLDYFRSQGKEARIQRFPDRSEPKTGQVIDTFLREAKSVDEDREVIHLLFSTNRWILAKQIREDLARGVNLIVDRYSFSGVAYSLAKGLDKSWVCTPEVGLPRPDVVLFFDIDSTVTATRGGFGDEVLERSDFQKSVYEHMKEIFNESYWQKINAAETIEEVHKSITEKVDRTLKAVADGKKLESLALSDFGLRTN